ncbi:MAG: MBL fold metallo-hydrolase [Methanolinea sp.]|nr:MBL fold metallo-hydrolase [Methanolinea sp.]
MTAITVHDGAMGIGGNKILVEEGDAAVFLDFGKNFGKYGYYFEEFLTNRDTRGIHDLYHLDLVPRLNVYRADLVPSDLRLDGHPSPRVKAVLASHAHADHVGNVGLLDLSIPVAGSPLTLAIMKAMQDTSQNAGIKAEACYVSPRDAADGSGLVLRAASNRPHRARVAACTAPPRGALVEFLSRRPGQDAPKAKRFEPADCLPLDALALPFDVAAHEVDHSIYGATAYVLRGDVTVAYTGDIRLHGAHGEKTRDFASRARDATVLVIEGTRAGRGEDPGGEGGSRTGERDVHETCRAACEDARGLVIADFSPRNFERLETFLRIARETGRSLVVTPKDIYLLRAMECADGIPRTGSLLVYDELSDGKNRKWESEVVVPLAGDRYVGPGTIRADPDGYILCFSFFDVKHLLDIKPEGGLYIYSACEAFSEEMEIDFWRLWNWIRRFGMEARGFSVGKDGKPTFEPGFHASGHAPPRDLAWIIDRVDPDVLVPVHTTNHAWFSENFGSTRIVRDGERLEF